MVFRSPAAPDPARLSKSIVFKRNLKEKSMVFRSPAAPTPARLSKSIVPQTERSVGGVLTSSLKDTYLAEPPPAAPQVPKPRYLTLGT